MRIHLTLIISLLTLCACNYTQKEKQVLRMKILRGPSAIAFAQLIEKNPSIDHKTIKVEIVDSPEIIQAYLIKGEADIVVLPLLSAVNLYNKGIRYPLLGCPLWGTLYIIGRNPSAKTLNLFGSGTSPDILTRYYLDKNPGWKPSLNYTSGTANEVMIRLLSGTIETAVLSEPFVSMALRRDPSLKIVANLNQLDKKHQGFAQTAVIFNPSLEKQTLAINKILANSCSFAVEYPDKAIAILEKNKVFGKGMLSREGIERCRIRYVPACEAKESVISFLEIIRHYEPKAIGGKLPDSNFIPCK